MQATHKVQARRASNDQWADWPDAAGGKGYCDGWAAGMRRSFPLYGWRVVARPPQESDGTEPAGKPEKHAIALIDGSLSWKCSGCGKLNPSPHDSCPALG